MFWTRPGPALVEFNKEERVFEGPAQDDGLHQVDEGHHHEADEEEGDEGPQVVPGHGQPVAQAAEPTRLPCVSGAAGRVRSWSPVAGFLIGV